MSGERVCVCIIPAMEQPRAAVVEMVWQCGSRERRRQREREAEEEREREGQW